MVSARSSSLLSALRSPVLHALALLLQVGGSTGLIGDPSGRSSERNLLSGAELQRNIDGITRDISRFLEFAPTSTDAPAATSTAIGGAAAFDSRALLLNNASWFSALHVIPFFRDVGRHFRVNIMLTKDSVASRLSSTSGMSFTEFSYQLLQAYDFMHLHKTHQCAVQIGGSDQWGNILSGIDLIRRDAATAHREKQLEIHGAAAVESAAPEVQVFGLTLPLLTTAAGVKFGKSMGNSPIWLSAPTAAESTAAMNAAYAPTVGGAPAVLLKSTTSSPYEFYQYFLNSTADVDLIRYLKLFTDLSLEEIAALEAEHYGKNNPLLGRILAESVTRIVHGDAGVLAAQAATSALFGGKLDGLASLADFLSVFAGVPTRQFARSDLLARPVVDLAVEVGLAKSKGEARRLIAAGGVYINNERLTSDAHIIATSDLLMGERVCVLRSGKKKQFVLLVRDAEV
jgi:tyrosyl-tRNA synthetase